MRPSSATYLSSSEIPELVDPSMARPSKPLGNFFQHDFRGATPDGLDTGIACHSLNGTYPNESHPAMKLDAVVHHRIHQFAAVGFHHRDLASHVLALCI